MRTGTVSYRLEDLKNGVIIPIGFVGENDFTKVFFDAEEIYKKYPNASVSMKVQPPKGGIYPATVTRDGNTVIWQVKEADVANRGGGELQLTFTDGETKIKTYIAKTDVKRSLAGNGPAPDPVQGWIDDAEEVLDDLEAMDTIAKNAQAGDIGKALSPKTVEDGVVTEWQYIEMGGGTEDYSDLENKPSIGGVTLAGDKSLHELGIAAENDIPDVSGKANLTVIAPAFDQATANDAGSMVTYTDGVVYVLPDGHTAGTTWANTTKTATNIDTELRLQKNDIQQIEETTNEVNPLIDLFGVIGKTKEAYTAENLAHPRKITFIGNPYAFGNCRVANRKNYITKVDAGAFDLNGVTLTKRSGVLIYELNGTCTGSTEGSTVWDSNVIIPKGTYRYFIEIDKGESTIIAGASFKLQFKYDGERSYRNVTKYVEKESESDYLDITFEKDVIALNPRVFAAKNNVYVNYFVWLGLYKNDVNIIDTNETIDDGETYDFVYEYSNIFDVIDTMQHKSAVETIVQTNKALPFVTPEMFGAVGDDSADDTNPLQNCINYAISNGCMVYGKGKYRVTKTIKINGNQLFFRINKLSAWSNTISNYILEIEGSNNIIEIATIAAQYGILLTSHSNTNTKRNYLNIRNMSVSIGHAITLSGTDSYISYNSFHLGQITANAGNCIHTVNFATENWFYGGMMVCPNGWAFYNPAGYKCYNASFEKDCYGGIYLEAGKGGMFVGCRSVELTDKITAREYGKQDVPPGGTLIKLVGGYNNFIYYSSNPIPYEAIDTSEATDVTDPTFDDDPDYDWRPDWRRSSTMANISRVIARISLGHDNSKGGNATLGNEMIVFNGRKVCKPNRKAVCTIEEADFDMRDIYGSQAHNFPYATKYRINVANCVIHLATSYCCEGYNELIIDQSDPTKLCTIYKSSDSVTPIFDGQTEGAGIYKLSCECDYSLTADMLPSNWTKPTYYYNGYNDVWTVEKLS